MPGHYMRLGIPAAFVLAMLPFLLAPAAEPASKLAAFTGKVVPLKTVLEKSGIKLDKDAGGVALVTDDGHVYPLVKDDGGRMFFKDERLLNRPMRLSGKLVADGRMLQVNEASAERRDLKSLLVVSARSRFEKQDCDNAVQMERAGAGRNELPLFKPIRRGRDGFVAGFQYA